MMNLGHVITLRVPPSRIREVNLSVKRTAWGMLKAEFYITYDYREVVKQRKAEAEQAK